MVNDKLTKNYHPGNSNGPTGSHKKAGDISRKTYYCERWHPCITPRARQRNPGTAIPPVILPFVFFGPSVDTRRFFLLNYGIPVERE